MLIRRVLKSNARLLLALTATVMASAPICSHADESAPSPKIRYANTTSYKVIYSDPASAEGARRLYSQIERAATYACGGSSTDIETVRNAYAACVHNAVSRAIYDTKNVNLAHVYIERNGKDEAQKFGISSDLMTAKK